MKKSGKRTWVTAMSNAAEKDRLPFSISHYLCPADVALTDFLDHVTRSGFTAVALTEAALRELPSPALQHELAARGLVVSSVNSAGYFLFEGEAARAQDRRNHELLGQTAALGEARLNVIVGGNSAMPLADARKKAIEALARFSEEAARLSVSLALEPYVPWRAATHNCINTISQVEAIIASIPTLTTTVDLYHLWWEPDLAKLLAGASVPIGLMQICDVAITGDELPRRVPLDEGFLPWRTHTGMLRADLPDVPIELELFASQLPDRHWPQILSASAHALASLMET